jgi:queuine tRNA-ribosyltransferase
LSVGEPKAVLLEMLSASIDELPTCRPRYLMGVGSPEDLWNCVALGIDMFDCVLPTRAARHGGLYTPSGRINIRASAYRERDEAVDLSCDCYTCRTASTAYLHHLFRTGELSAFRLASIHNLRFVVRQTELMRAAIRAGVFAQAHRAFLDTYRAVDEMVRDAQRGKFRLASEARRS